MTTKIIIIVKVVTVALLLQANISERFLGIGKMEINVTNAFTAEKSLIIHCKQKGQDLGPHVLTWGDTYIHTYNNN